MMIFIFALLYAWAILAVGLACLIWPEHLRKWFLSQHHRKWWGFLDPLKLDRHEWMETVYRVTGVLFIFCSFLLQVKAARIWWLVHR
jgi:hypothetical protein